MDRETGLERAPGQYQPNEPSGIDSQFPVGESPFVDPATQSKNSESDRRCNIVTIDRGRVGLALADALRTWLATADVVALRRSLLEVLTALDA